MQEKMLIFLNIFLTEWPAACVKLQIAASSPEIDLLTYLHWEVYIKLLISYGLN